MSKNTIKPGDIIEWVYNKAVVDSNEVLYSTSMGRCVPIGGTALLISVDDEVYVWLSDKGLFHARVDDARVVEINKRLLAVVPRARG